MNRSRHDEARRSNSQRRCASALSASVLVAVTVMVVAALVGAATRTITWLPRALLSVYFPPFWVTGTPDARLVVCTLFLVLAAFLLYRHKYWAASAAVILPMIATWIFAWRMMGG